MKLHRSIALAMTVAIAACGAPAGPFVVPATKPAEKKPSPFTVRLAHGSLREQATREQLEGLVSRYDLGPWLFTREVVIDDDAIPHSHPVLTLHTRHLGSDDQLLSTFLHEELHHHETNHHEETARAIAELRTLLPGLPVGFPDGASTEESSYLHVIVNHFEYVSLARIVGKERADATFGFWETDHYRAIYRAERENRAEVAAVVARAGLVPAFLVTATPPAPARFDVAPLQGDPYPRAAAGEVDERVLSEMIGTAEATQSSSFLVIHDGKLVAERTFEGERDKLVQTMSVSKSFSSLAIGYLIEEKKIPSVDVPLAKYFPDFAKGQKAKITLLQVLNHTTGIEHGKNANALDRSPDRVAYVRKLPLVSEPGAQFSYNNEASALLAGVIRQASGMEVDEYLAPRLFAPLGITHYTWQKDDAKHTCTYHGLSLSARDLAKVGMVLMDGGRYQGKQVVPPGWLEAATKAARPDLGWIGRLIWLEREGPFAVQTSRALAEFAPPGFPIAKLAPLDGRRFASRSAYWTEVGALLSPDERARFVSLVRDDKVPLTWVEAKILGYRMDGWLGQLLLWYPEKKLVVVRQHAYVAGDETREGVGAPSIVSLAPKLVRGK